MKKNIWFSKITLIFAAYIIISASFMLQVRNFLARSFGAGAVRAAFFSLFFLTFIFYTLYRLYYKKPPLYKIMAGLVTFGLAYFLIEKQPYFAEKLHILEYGLLGYLAFRDFAKNDGKNRLILILYSICFVAVIGAFDEVFQEILPYRVFEVRDILTNVLSGLLGVSLSLFDFT